MGRVEYGTGGRNGQRRRIGVTGRISRLVAGERGVSPRLLRGSAELWGLLLVGAPLLCLQKRPSVLPSRTAAVSCGRSCSREGCSRSSPTDSEDQV